jgi:MFS family permease
MRGRIWVRGVLGRRLRQDRLALAADSADLRLTLVFCAIQVLALSGTLAFPALIPEFRTLWQLSATEAGWIAAVSYIAYAVAAPLLVGLTDRIDARGVVISSCLISAAAGFGFALSAEGFWSALVWRALAGIGIAGSYMPGLKALSDRLRGPRAGRMQSFYTASFSLGSALSLFLTGTTAALLDWQSAFIATGLLALCGAGLVAAAVASEPPAGAQAGRWLPDPRPVLRDRQVMAFVLAYAAHTFELFAFRTWAVAFLTYATSTTGNELKALVPSLATLLVLLGLPASIVGNELATRFDRRRALAAVMTASAGLGIALAALASGPLLLFVPVAILYACLVMADSAAITVGTLASTPAARRGTTIAVQTLPGSVMAMASPMLAGLTLDLFADDPATGWLAAFTVTGAGALIGPLVLLRYGRSAGAPGERA